MTTKTDRYKPEFIESFPDSMNPGILYISIEFGTCGHLCACGCGNEVITPLGPAQWSFTYDGRNASLRPSIGNWSLPCKSHYIIDRGGIVRWARTFTDREIARNPATATAPSSTATTTGFARRRATPAAPPPTTDRRAGSARSSRNCRKDGRHCEHGPAHPLRGPLRRREATVPHRRTRPPHHRHPPGLRVRPRRSEPRHRWNPAGIR